MDRTFSLELKELIAHSREIAIELGYDYISTIHFFLADCESKRANSIKNFGFKDDVEYQNFKNEYTVEKKNKHAYNTGSLPLTKEAETTLRLSEKERKLQGHNLVFPRHLFIAALKNSECLVFECYKHDEKALEKLVAHYEEIGEPVDTKTEDNELTDQTETKENNSGILFMLKKIFRKAN